MEKIQKRWETFQNKYPGISRLLLFFVLSNGVTLMQLLLMPLVKSLFGLTSLIDINFQVGAVGKGHPQYYVFDYAKGALAAGGGGGLAYFLAVQMTLAAAQVINFFLQRNITFKATNSVKKAAMWYIIAYLFITLGAAVLQGFYKQPIYEYFISSIGSGGEIIADIITMLINSVISFWVFYPIMKIIFKSK
ncbi:hypothetical protein [Ohessyouella blattaphilus]|uniref:GtrA-like protein domain-containing protein n=1 Tax=Ohessyouella blattaphilus TaxID=2949333 RepID=A0ABT1EIX1_9FIRM|nr:hypothetical protein [Ohessyouella blattaphilus]MCP1110419.1 hypothetical protein [Ohessyouella blattaphilus]MCR8563813.1 hypothetical protein [Ohessyouella blattaphilus]MDL2249991.1 hypothetical protein [Lachnospiraceae bacterium OttesenSCG-928-J05]